MRSLAAARFERCVADPHSQVAPGPIDTGMLNRFAGTAERKPGLAATVPLEFEARFSSEEGCREYLSRLRWPDGFRRPRCGGGKAWAVRATLFQCSGCEHQTSVMAGVFQDMRKPLTIWFRAMWYVTSQKNGA